LDNFEQLSIDILSRHDNEIWFKYKNVGGKILVTDKGIDLYTLFDIYKKENVIKKMYHYDPKRKVSRKGQMVEFSRSGTLAPGPC